MDTASVVCVLGMHRSGTSAVTRALNLLGVDLGLPERLIRPREDNPEGFWENLDFTEVNDEILTRQGGCWHEPPTFAPGWEQSPDLSDLGMRVAALVRENFAGRALWGWKDPRACLTLPFWRALLPPMRYVLCVRSPLAVAHSLRERDGFPIEKGGRLWLRYVISALINTAGSPRRIVEYEGFLSARDREVQRLARLIGRPDVAEVRRAVEESVRRDLQHHRGSLGDTLTERRLPFPARALYAQLRLALSHEDPPGEVDEEDEVLTVLARVAGEEQAASFELQHRGLLAESQRLARDGERLIRDRERLTRDRERLTRDRERLVREGEQLRTDVRHLQAALSRSQQALVQVERHPIWRAYRRLRSALLPGGSRREVAYVRTRGWLAARRRTHR